VIDTTIISTPNKVVVNTDYTISVIDTTIISTPNKVVVNMPITPFL
jgi:hypothetical protein